MANDLDAPTALAVIDAWAAGSGDDTEAGATARTAIDALLGIAL